MASSGESQAPTISEEVARSFASLRLDDIPASAQVVAVSDLVDVAGLCIAARQTDYIQPLIRGWDEDGECTAIGHSRALSPAGAALVNGTATHGEDFDDTLEGAGIRLGAMVIPAVLAACEQFDRSGADALIGIVTGLEVIARVSHVAPGGAQKAGFHHVGVMGVFGAALGVGMALGCDARQIGNAMGLAASFSSGLITSSEWTKRIHPGLAAGNGYRAAVLARNGFEGPRSVFDGSQNFFRAFTPESTPDYSYLTEGLGERWMMERIVFKPYACATTIQPYIDCMLHLAARGVDPLEIVSIVCPTSEAIVGRQWEPLSSKQAPSTGYSAKYSAPYAMAVAFYDGDAGLAQFSDERVGDQKVLDLAAKITYRIDPSDPYPDNYTGYLIATLSDGSVIAEAQPHIRGGVRQPLTTDQLLDKFRGNIAHGGWHPETGDSLADFCTRIAELSDLRGLVEFRQ